MPSLWAHSHYWQQQAAPPAPTGEHPPSYAGFSASVIRGIGWAVLWAMLFGH